MQTFMVYDVHAETAKVLDTPRLGKQRVEVLQMLNVLHEVTTGYGNHPCVKMWRGHEWALAQYGLTICRVWIDRGFKDTCYGKILAHAQAAQDGGPEAMLEPDWWVNEPMRLAIIRSHRSNLIRKDERRYGPLWPDVPGTLDYVWPV